MLKTQHFILPLFVFIFVLITASHCQCQKIYKSSWNKEAPIYGTSFTLLMNGLYIEHRKEPITESSLSLLTRPSLSGLDESTITRFSDKASKQSDYFKDGIVAVPFALMLSKQGRENAGELLMMYTEVVALNSGITLFTKNAIGRYRPYVFNADVPIELKLSNTSRKSFFSGHTSHVASLSFFTAKVFTDLYPESKWRYLVWAGAVAAPAMTGYLRVKAGRHYPTDVIVGYGIGAMIGFFIPHIHKVTRDSNVRIVGAEGGLGMVYTFD